MKSYKDVNRDILKSLPNPTVEAYELKAFTPEFTFLGADKQPDFSRIYITFYPAAKIIELKSLKLYFFQFRDIHISYERLINHMFDDLMAVYEPIRLRLVIEFFPRGGISSRVVVDSDWAVRGGKEEFWSHDEDWSFKTVV